MPGDQQPCLSDAESTRIKESGDGFNLLSEEDFVRLTAKLIPHLQDVASKELALPGDLVSPIKQACAEKRVEPLFESPEETEVRLRAEEHDQTQREIREARD